MSCGSPRPAGCPGGSLNRQPPGGPPGSPQEAAAYRSARIPHAFLNQEKALKRARKSFMSPGLFCHGCVSIRRSHGPRCARGRNLFKYREKQQGCFCSRFTSRKVAGEQSDLASPPWLARKHIGVESRGKHRTSSGRQAACAVVGNVCWAWGPDWRTLLFGSCLTPGE